MIKTHIKINDIETEINLYNESEKDILNEDYLENTLDLSETIKEVGNDYE